MKEGLEKLLMTRAFLILTIYSLQEQMEDIILLVDIQD